MRRLLASSRPPESFGAPLVRVTQGSLRAEALLRVFYAFPIFWGVTHLDALRPLVNPPLFYPRWPIAWIHAVGPDVGARTILVLGLATALAGVILPGVRCVRVGVFLGLLQVLALQYSFGKIHHLMHGWLYVSFIYAAFLPNGAFRAAHASRRERQLTLLVMQAAQAMLGLTYSLAGVGKLLGTVYQAALGQTTPIHPSALARHIADRLLQTYPDSILGPWMIEYGVWLWPLMLATLYLQLFAFVAAFRPSLHRLWGFGLIAFHVTTALTMTIDFSPNVLLLGLLFSASPTAFPDLDLRRIAKDLPVLGHLLPARILS